MAKRRIRSAAAAAAEPEVADPPTEPGAAPNYGPCERVEIERRTRAAGGEGDEPEGDQLYEITISSENAVRTPWGYEVLGHGEGEIDLRHAGEGVSWLLEHGGPNAPYRVDPEYHAGHVSGLRQVGKKLRGAVGWAPDASQRVQQAEKAFVAGKRPFVSVGWIPGPDFRTTVIKRDGKPDMIRHTGWCPVEASSVSVPADFMARKGRSGPGIDGYPVVTEGVTPVKEERTMKFVRNAAGNALIEVEDSDPRQAVTSEQLAQETSTRSTAIQTQERQRVVRIQDLCGKLGKKERAAKFIAEGTSFDDAFDQLMVATPTPVGAQPGSEAIVPGVSKKEIRAAGGYNILRAIRCALTNDFDNSFEGDLHKAIIAKLPTDFARPSERHVLVPLRCADLSEGEFVERNQLAQAFMAQMMYMRSTSPLGTGMPGTAPIIGRQMLEPVDLLRNVAMLASLGARVYPNLSGMVEVPVKEDAPAVQRKEENPASAATQTTPSWGFKQATPKAYIGDVPIPIQVIHTASIDAQAEAQNDLLVDSYLAMDFDGLYGSGTNNSPLGLYPDAETQELSMGAAVPSWKKIQKAIGMVANYNIPGQGIGIITTPPVATELCATLRDAAVAGYIWDGRYDDGNVGGYRGVSTNQMRQTHSTDSRTSTGGTQHGWIEGSFGWLNFLLWGAILIKVDDVTLFTKGQVRVMSQMLGTVLNRRPKAFVVGKGVAIS